MHHSNPSARCLHSNRRLGGGVHDDDDQLSRQVELLGWVEREWVRDHAISFNLGRGSQMEIMI